MLQLEQTPGNLIAHGIMEVDPARRHQTLLA